MKKLSPLLLPLLSSLLVVSLSFGQTTYTFNDPDELESEFTIVNDGTANNWNWQSAGGLNNSGVVQIGSNSNLLSSGFILNRGQSTEVASFSISTFFEYRASSSPAYQSMIGIVPGTDAPFSVGGGASDPTGLVQLGVGLNLGSSGTRFGWMNNDSYAFTGSMVTLDEGAWYWLSADFSRIDSTWTIDVALREATAQGDIGSVVISGSQVLENSAILEGDAIYAMFGIRSTPDIRGVDKIDNFTTTIPEPSTVAALFGVVVLAAAVLRTRSRR